LPAQLFYSTQITACLWFLNRNKQNGHSREGWRDRRQEILFIDARALGVMVDRTHRDLTDEDVAKIASTYHSWRGEPGSAAYENVLGFCGSATVAEIAAHSFVLTPGRFVGSAEPEDDGEPIDEKIARLTTAVYQAFDESDEVQARVRDALGSLDA
jgi:type I restriction enzyme M protein